jgi:hypothetical protein
MQIPNFRRIFKTDYPADQQPLVEKLSGTVNNGLEVIYNAMAKNVSLGDNIFCTIKTITTRVDANGVPTSTLSFKIDTTGQIKGISVIRANNQTSSTVYPNSCPFLTYSQDNITISVSHIAGLPANNTFDLTVISWG